MQRSALWRNRLSLLLYRILRRRRRTSFLNDVTCGRTRRIARFGMEAAEQDGSDAVDGGRSHLTGEIIANPLVQSLLDSYVENSRDTPQTPIDAL